ncbi:MAG: UDP-2,4-diacetamido-2,4,6-trideoxy-beta-L-altropyranose hydrolase [Chloroflexota bacterium]|nr:MAG: UDP-2,4-diacetamido-2,4,6-trideoxy-beta-L-altropyranose hydrolase [Chloroflexota bacterium]
MSHLLIRTDGDRQIGAGHVMRCLALAQAWQETGGSASIALAKITPGLETRLRSEGLNLHHLTCLPGSREDAKQTIELAQQTGAAWVVADSYHFDADYQQALKRANLRLLVVDDYGHAGHYYADLVLNQNIYAEPSLYINREPDTDLLLGTQYVLLRREFWPWHGWQREITPQAWKVLVTLGGGDPDNFTLKVLQTLKQVTGLELEVMVVVGPANPHLAVLQHAVEHAPYQVQLLNSATNMPELMVWADIAISAGGSTCWELAFMGVPSLVFILADNQAAVAKGIAARGGGLNLGWYNQISNFEQQVNRLLFSSEQRASMSQKGQQLVDGQGRQRVLVAMSKTKLNLRPAEESDCELLWQWANEAEVRKSAFHSQYIPWENHVQWFAKKLKDSHCFQFLAFNEQNEAVGQVRFDLANNEEAEIDVSIDKRKRGLGYGALLIKEGVASLAGNSSITCVHSFVKIDNQASIRAFEKAGFIQQGSELVKEQLCVHLIWKKDDE